jgi:hypothetical protein
MCDRSSSSRSCSTQTGREPCAGRRRSTRVQTEKAALRSWDHVPAFVRGAKTSLPWSEVLLDDRARQSSPSWSRHTVPWNDVFLARPSRIRRSIGSRLPSVRWPCPADVPDATQRRQDDTPRQARAICRGLRGSTPGQTPHPHRYDRWFVPHGPTASRSGRARRALDGAHTVPALRVGGTLLGPLRRGRGSARSTAPERRSSGAARTPGSEPNRLQTVLIDRTIERALPEHARTLEPERSPLHRRP